jgi:hypothetical protein
MKKLISATMIAGSLFAVMIAGRLFAQKKSPDQADADIRKELDRLNTAQFISGINVGPVTKNAPYSAEAVTESVQKLYDGNRIVEKSTTKVYRDSEGRERREEGSPMNAVFITDPVAKTSYTLYPETKTASKTSGAKTFFFQASNSKSEPFFVRSSGATVFNGAVHVLGTNAVSTPPNLTVTVGPEPGSGKVEDLGTQVIEGVQAKGTRATTIIPAGQIGNDREIEVVDERWYSSDLQLTVMTRHSDPRVGENTYKLTNIQRIEQVRSLFEIPPNYTIATEEVFGKKILVEPAPAKKEE